MKKILLCVFGIAIILQANAQKRIKNKLPEVKKTVLKNETDSFSYALGMSIGESLKNSGTTNVNKELFTTAMNSVFYNTATLLTRETANATLQQKLQEFTQRKKEMQIQEGKNFLFINGKRPTVTTLPNGLQYEVIVAGNPNSPKPKITDTVVVNYAGTLINGTEFENSFKNGGPVTFPLNGVIKGWSQILQLMPKGASWKVYIPSELAYGDNPPSADIPLNAVLIFELALIDIKTAFTSEK